MIKMNLSLLIKYINYRLTSFTEHDLHSPFLYDFYMELIRNNYVYQDFEELNHLRKKLLHNTQEINIVDLGAGSKSMTGSKRKINDITHKGIASKKQAEFLYRLLNKFNPKTIIELGTSVGLTTLYLSKVSPKSTIYTIEGCPDLVKFSKKLFKENSTSNIISIEGNFDTELPKLLNQIPSLDFIYIDGNHTYEATIRYFNMVLEKKHSGTMVVFDDIYWSEGMEKAWKEIHNHSQVRLSMDLFHFGLVFFRTENKEKEHFVLRF